MTYNFVADPFWNEVFNSLARPGAAEFVANGPNQFFVTHKGVKEKVGERFNFGAKSYLNSIKTHLIPFVHSNIPFNENGALFEGHYKIPGEGGFEGRCHIMLDPTTLSPCVTMTKIAGTSNTLESIAASGSMATEMLEFIQAAIKAKLTIVLSGQSGAGKTTTMQAMTKLFDPQDRVGIGEDLPELKLEQPNVFYLHTVPWIPGFDPNKVVTLDWIVKQFLRMRPDRVIIGETRGKEFADFLVAANAGMKGSMTTLHAEDPAGAMDKMTRFALQGSERQPIRAINKEIGSAVDLVIQLARINGKHRMTHIEEITNTVGNSDDAKLASQTLYKYDPIQDNWIKDSIMTDQLRKKFELAGIDPVPFAKKPAGARLEKHGVGLSSPGLRDVNFAPSSQETFTLPQLGRRV